MGAESHRNAETSFCETAAIVRPSWGDPPASARQLSLGHHASGWEWRDRVGRWCLLTNVVSGAPEATDAEQTEHVLDRMSSSLNATGMDFGHVVRTWFFLDDILSWYDTFNQVRTRFFERHDLLRCMPASTAVGPRVDGGPRILAGLLALRPDFRGVTVEPVPSPAQGSAFDYGSSFSRATEVSWPEGKRLYVSGTASIDPVGRTLHAGDFSRQADATFRVVEDLLDSRELSFGDVTQVVGYVACQSDASLARLCAAAYFTKRIPTLVATICRPDLDFEIELIAERAMGTNRPSRINRKLDSAF